MQSVSGVWGHASSLMQAQSDAPQVLLRCPAELHDCLILLPVSHLRSFQKAWTNRLGGMSANSYA